VIDHQPAVDAAVDEAIDQSAFDIVGAEIPEGRFDVLAAEAAKLSEPIRTGLAAVRAGARGEA